MGGSDKPSGGYDKKTMAKDVYELLLRVGYEKAYITGHDIGSMVAFSFAANHAEAARGDDKGDGPILPRSELRQVGKRLCRAEVGIRFCLCRKICWVGRN
jgi:pimeloyl-ACP methyl ester carboxylesterase